MKKSLGGGAARRGTARYKTEQRRTEGQAKKTGREDRPPRPSSAAPPSRATSPASAALPSPAAPAAYQYYGSFAPGLEDCIAEILRERSPDTAIPLLLSGAAVFETSLSYDRLNFFCFNNLFRVIDVAAAAGTGGPSRENLEHFVRRIIRRNPEKKSPANPAGALSGGSARSFRLIFSLENTPAAVSEDLRGEAERFIASLSGLRVNRSSPDMEFWFLQRREGAFFMRRLTRRRPWDKLLHPGELPPPLAWTLCKLSDPRPGERVADPFCGYGSIPAARLRHFPPAEFFASDSDPGVLKIGAAKFKGTPRRGCRFSCLDVRDLPRLIPPASLDSVITDPPWGHYRNLPIGELYDQSLKVFAALLKPGGRAVILCGRGEELTTAAARHGFTTTRTMPILLSGRKAVVYVLRIGRPCSA
ncbi:MAG: hypothetical protein LBH51_02730 [Treponema sp.]|nr:hypothetical protein [Treponema sp.]